MGNELDTDQIPDSEQLIASIRATTYDHLDYCRDKLHQIDRRRDHVMKELAAEEEYWQREYGIVSEFLVSNQHPETTEPSEGMSVSSRLVPDDVYGQGERVLRNRSYTNIGR